MKEIEQAVEAIIALNRLALSDEEKSQHIVRIVKKSILEITRTVLRQMERRYDR